MKTVFVSVYFLIVSITGIAAQDAACCGVPHTADAPPPVQEEVCPLQKILDRLHENAAALTACTSKLEYLVIQEPDLLDSHALRKGFLYYLKTEQRSQVKIVFDTLRQDDFDQEERREVYLFDGVWLTKVDYALEQVDRYQQAPEDQPLDAFDFISHHFPLVGFSGSRQLETDFEVRFADAAADDPNRIGLHLEVKPQSRYSKDYKTVDFWIDRNDYLPRCVRTLSTQGDIYEITFLDIQTHKKPAQSIFTIETPAHFRTHVEPLKEHPQTKGQD